MIKAKYGVCTECDNDKEVLLYRRNPPQCQYHYQKQKAQIYKKRADAKEKKKAKPIAKVSKKRQAGLRLYEESKKRRLKEYPVCEVRGCHNPSNNIHHRAGRTGQLLWNYKYLMACCGSCHPRRIHFEQDYPGWARAEGYIVTIDLKKI